jgi:hypothetical protein
VGAAAFDLRELPRDSLRLAVFPDVYLTYNDAEDVFVRAADGCVAVLVDSLRAATPGIDENSSEARRFVDMLGRVSERTGATILLIHHARKPSGDGPRGARYALRGSSALYDGWVRCSCSARKRGSRRVSRMRSAAPGGSSWRTSASRFEDVQIGNDPRAGLRVVHLEPEQLAARAAPDSSPTRDLERVRAFLREHGPHRGNRDSLRERIGMGAGPFRRALSLLEATGEVCVRRDEGGLSIEVRA